MTLWHRSSRNSRVDRCQAKVHLLLCLEGHDPLAAGCAGNGDRADRAERAACGDLELVDDPVGACLDVEEAAVCRTGGVELSPGRSRCSPRARRSQCSSPWNWLTDHAPRIRRVQVAVDGRDPTRGRLARGEGVKLGRHAAGAERELTSAPSPVSATTRLPAASKVTAKGTAFGSEFTVGVADSCPLPKTWTRQCRSRSLWWSRPAASRPE